MSVESANDSGAAVDPLDSEVALAGAPSLSLLDVLLRRRAALGMPPTMPPAILFLPIGFALGPLGLNFLSTPALGHLDPVISVALAVLGVFIGLARDVREPGQGRLLAAAAIEASVTILVVSLATFWLLRSWALPLETSVVFVALMLGICAAASSATSAVASQQSPHPVHRIASRIANLDDWIPVIAGGCALATVRAPDTVEALKFLGLTCLLGVLLATAGWLLFERASGAAERGVYVVGILVVLGGGAAYLRLSPLLAGAIAGMFWRLTPGGADRVVREDLHKIQHPLIVILLLVAGASLTRDWMAVWLLAAYVVARIAGKLSGGWLASRALVRNVSPIDLGAYLIPPGLVGIAFALNVLQISGGRTGAAVLTAAAVGSLVSEVIALAVLTARRSA